MRWSPPGERSSGSVDPNSSEVYFTFRDPAGNVMASTNSLGSKRPSPRTTLDGVEPTETGTARI